MHYNLYSKANQYIIDGVLIGISFAVAYVLRFEGEIPPPYVYQFWGLLPVVIAGRLLANHLFRTYRQMWRYVSIPDVIQLTRPFVAFSGIVVAMRIVLQTSLSPLRIPLSVIVIEALISFTGLLSVRLLRRILYQRHAHPAASGQETKRVLLVGAGWPGVVTASMLAPRPDRRVVGFLDDDPQKTGAVIAGLPVLGPLNQLAHVVQQQGVSEVVICLARAPRQLLKRIWRLCDGLNVRTLIVPAMEELLEGEIQVSRLRQVNMEELLGRETVDALSDRQEVLEFYRGKRILVTGAGGSIGSELARQLAGFDPGSLLLFDKDENGLYELSVHFSELSPTPRYNLLVGDLRSRERLRSLFETHGPEIVFHAAAHKHVPLMEANPAEAVLNNVFGTRNLVEQAIASETSLLVFISTDKAVRPVSVMGGSKRLGELLVQSHRHQKKTRFACARFGNVMSSRGSVIPLFQKQIAAGGPVTLTDPEVSRYFMTIPEAVQLVIQVGLLRGENGSIYVLDMKNPIRIADLVRDLIELSGLRPNQDILIETVGLRPGERLQEELVDENEQLNPTENPRIFVVNSAESTPAQGFGTLLDPLWQAAERNEVEKIYEIFQAFGFGVQPGRPCSVRGRISDEPNRRYLGESADRART